MVSYEYIAHYEMQQKWMCDVVKPLLIRRGFKVIERYEVSYLAYFGHTEFNQVWLDVGDLSLVAWCPLFETCRRFGFHVYGAGGYRCLYEYDHMPDEDSLMRAFDCIFGRQTKFVQLDLFDFVNG